ncbi:unnamed protein product [Schistosoma margrebowiei]|nr:unnamed protein product [Schistosoma margrebowiei]
MKSRMMSTENDGRMMCYFIHKCLKYVWNGETHRFELIR